MSVDMEKIKICLCQNIAACDGPFLLPCGSKSDNPKYCEDWKQILIEKEDEDKITVGENGNLNLPTEVFERIKKNFFANHK